MDVTLPRHATAPRQEDPARIGPYAVLGRLGTGEIRPVYLARSSYGQWLAVHTVYPTDATRAEVRDAFQLDAERARAIDSPHVTRVLDTSVDGHVPYLVSEFVDGPTLDEEIAARGPLSGVELRRVAVAVASAVDAFTRARIVHSRLTPSDVILGVTGPRVVDLGLSGRMRELIVSANRAGRRASSSAAADDVRPAPSPTNTADVFAWGAVVAYAATGHAITTPPEDCKPPASGGEAPPAQAGHSGTLPASPPDPEDCDAGELWALVSAALDEDPAHRPDPADLVARLADTVRPDRTSRRSRIRPAPTAEILGNPPAAPTGGLRRPRHSTTSPARRRRRRAAIGLTLATVVATGAVAADVFAQSSGSPTRTPAFGPASTATSRPAAALSATPPSASPTPAGRPAVDNLSVNGQPVVSGQQITVHGPRAGQSLRGRITGTIPAGDHLFVISTPPLGTASFVQGEIQPDAGGAWALVVSVGSDGTYYRGGLPDRMTVFLADQRASATLQGYEAPPNQRRHITTLPAVTRLAHVDIVKIPR